MEDNIVPDAVGKEVGVREDLRRGFPSPREINSQQHQKINEAGHGTSKDIKVAMKKKIQGQQ